MPSSERKEHSALMKTICRSEMMMRPMCMAMAMCMMRYAHFSAAGGIQS